MKKSNPRSGELRSRATFWGAAILVGLVALLAIVLVVTGDGSDDEPDPSTTPTVTPTAGPSATGTGDALPAGFVTLPVPTAETDGFPTGYPHTPEGAAALVMAFHRAGSTLDYEVSARAVRAYVTGLDEAGLQELADGSVTLNRQKSKVTLTGPAPLGAGVATRHDGVKWREVDDEDVVVSLAIRIEYTHADGTRSASQGSMNVPVTWRGDRWWLDGGSHQIEDIGEAPAYATPGSEAYTAAGWKVIRNADWAGSLQ